MAPPGLRRGGRADAERFVPPGRLLPACRGQGGCYAGLCDGVGRGARRRDRRRRPVQLRQVAVRTGRRRFQRRDQHADTLHRPLSFVAPRRGGPDAAHRRLLQFARLRCGLPSHPVDAFDRRRHSCRVAEDHLFPGAGGLRRRRLAGRTALPGGVRSGERQSQIRRAQRFLAGRDRLCAGGLSGRRSQIQRLSAAGAAVGA